MNLNDFPNLTNLSIVQSLQLKSYEMDPFLLQNLKRFVINSDNSTYQPPQHHNCTIEDRKWGSLMCHALGDALCLSSEFQDPPQAAICYGCGFDFLPSREEDEISFFSSIEDLKTSAFNAEKYRKMRGGIIDFVSFPNLDPNEEVDSNVPLFFQQSIRSPFEYFLRDTHRIRWKLGDHSDDTGIYLFKLIS
jgi:hypothetical protein